MADTCRSCGAPIEWAITTNGRRIPLDVDSFDNGNIDLVDGIAYQTAHVTTTPDQRRRTHFASCPAATQHRKRDKAKRR